MNALTWLVAAGTDKRVGAAPLSQENGQLHGAVSVGTDRGENSSTGAHVGIVGWADEPVCLYLK